MESSARFTNRIALHLNVMKRACTSPSLDALNIHVLITTCPGVVNGVIHQIANMKRLAVINLEKSCLAGNPARITMQRLVARATTATSRVFVQATMVEKPAAESSLILVSVSWINELAAVRGVRIISYAFIGSLNGLFRDDDIWPEPEQKVDCESGYQGLYYRHRNMYDKYEPAYRL